MWPKSWLSMSISGMAPQLTATNGRAPRGLAAWIAAATSSLPTPLSPVISTLLGVGAQRAMCSRTATMAGLSPIRVWPADGAGSGRGDRPVSTVRPWPSARCTLSMRSSSSNGFWR